MTTKQKIILEKKVTEWRQTSIDERRSAWRAVLVDRVENSMAMEGEPVSREWLDKARANKA